MAFSLELGPPLIPGTTWRPAEVIGDLSVSLTSCGFSTVLPGGYGALQVRFQRPMRGQGATFLSLEQRPDTVGFGHVVLWEGAYRAFEGRIMVLYRANGGFIFGFDAFGYGLQALTDGVLDGESAALETSGSLFRQALQAKAPLLALGTNVVDPLVPHAPADFAGRSPGDMLNQFLSEGGNTATPWDYWVYEDRVVNFAPRVPPSGTPGDTVDYLLPGDETITWVEDYTQSVGGVVVTYAALSGASGAAGVGMTPLLTNPAFLTTYGFQRTQVVNGGTMRATSAVAFGQTYLGLNILPQYQVAVMRTGLRGMETPQGDTVEGWQVRANDWIQVGTDGALPPLPIIQTQFDCIAGSLQVQVGQPIPDGMNMIHRHDRIAGNVVRGNNPSTGARA